MITHSAKEIRQQNEQWGGGWRRQVRRVGQNLKKGREVGNIEFFS